jgi:hypothetical protein
MTLIDSTIEYRAHELGLAISDLIDDVKCEILKCQQAPRAATAEENRAVVVKEHQYRTLLKGLQAASMSVNCSRKPKNEG